MIEGLRAGLTEYWKAYDPLFEWTAAEKMTRFVDLCDTFHLPVVHFVDNLGGNLGSFDRIEYSHIRPQWMYRPATIALRVADIAVPAGLRVTYVPGVSDNVAPALAQLGIPVTVLAPEDVARTNLAGYTTVVVGPRASDRELDEARQLILDEPSRWIAQETVALSTHPTLGQGGKLEPRGDFFGRTFGLHGPQQSRFRVVRQDRPGVLLGHGPQGVRGRCLPAGAERQALLSRRGRHARRRGPEPRDRDHRAH